VTTPGGPGDDGPAGSLSGVGVSPGVVVGPVRRMADAVGQPPAGPPVEPDAREAEAARIVTAMAAVRDDLAARAARAFGEAVEVLEATALMAADPALAGAARERVTGRGLRAEAAVWEAAGEVAATLAALGGYLGERARDVHDVRDRIVAALTGRQAPGVPSPGHPFCRQRSIFGLSHSLVNHPLDLQGRDLNSKSCSCPLMAFDRDGAVDSFQVNLHQP